MLSFVDSQGYTIYGLCFLISTTKIRGLICGCQVKKGILK